MLGIYKSFASEIKARGVFLAETLQKGITIIHIKFVVVIAMETSRLQESTTELESQLLFRGDEGRCICCKR